MKRNLSRGNRNGLLGRVFVIGLLGMVASGWLASRWPFDSIAAALATATPPLGEVLVYSDNSPGAIVFADSMHQAIRRAGYATVVVLSEGTFTDEVASRNWSSVLVVTRFGSGTPGYAETLRNYVDQGGRAHLFRWRDDPAHPADPNSVVLAATAQQIWMNGFTALVYFNCKAAGPAKTMDGYVFGDFVGVEPLPATILSASGYEPLVAGTYAALLQQAPPAPPTTQQCDATLNDELDAAVVLYDKHRELCDKAYKPRPGETPPFPGNVEKWIKCRKEAMAGFGAALDAAFSRYEACMALANAAPQPAP